MQGGTVKRNFIEDNSAQARWITFCIGIWYPFTNFKLPDHLTIGSIFKQLRLCWLYIGERRILRLGRIVELEVIISGHTKQYIMLKASMVWEESVTFIFHYSGSQSCQGLIWTKYEPAFICDVVVYAPLVRIECNEVSSDIVPSNIDLGHDCQSRIRKESTLFPACCLTKTKISFVSDRKSIWNQLKPGSPKLISCH